MIIMEDIDFIGHSRHSSGRKGILRELLGQLDGVQKNEDIIFCASTNEVDLLDTALKDRPGRLDRIICIDLPGYNERVKMLELFAKDMKLEVKGFIG